MSTPAKAQQPTQRAASGPARALEKLGLRSDVDLALHLPLRYEDETRITPIAELRDGEVAQVEGQVSNCHVENRSRRQLIVRLDDGSGELLLRFLHF
jgi:ATP-dependent DNA helicase RecG